MKTRFIVFILGLLVAVAALGQQSSPGLVYGQVPSASQWNSYFAGKLDYNANGLPIALGGTGSITAPTALASLAGGSTSGQYLRGNGSGIVLSAIQAGDVPTLNQNTTGTAGALAGGLVGSIPYQSTVSVSAFLAGNTSTVPQFVTSTGTGTVAQAPTLTTSTGSGSVVLGTAPSISGATITTSTVNGNTITTGTGTLTLGTKTLTASNTLTLAGTDGTTMTFPSTSASIARIDASQTFTGTQTFSGVITGTATTTLFASPPALGASAASSGAFTTLSASSTVSGTGFSTYLASPPAIGGTSANTVKGTTVTATTGVNFASLAMSATAPTLASSLCGGSGGSAGTISAPNGTSAFRVTIGSNISTSTCVINMPTAATGWNCYAVDITTQNNAWIPRMSASSTTQVTITNYSAGSATNWPASDVLAVSCFAY